MLNSAIRIVPYSENYREDMLYCYTLAKTALGKVVKIQEDLLDIPKNYFDNGDMFWLAIDENDRVVGMVGTKKVTDVDLWLKRLFIKPNCKRQGLGTALLAILENFAKQKNVQTLHTRFGDDYLEAACFYSKCGFLEIERSEGKRHFVKHLTC